MAASWDLIVSVEYIMVRGNRLSGCQIRLIFVMIYNVDGSVAELADAAALKAAAPIGACGFESHRAYFELPDSEQMPIQTGALACV